MTWHQLKQQNKHQTAAYFQEYARNKESMTKQYTEQEEQRIKDLLTHIDKTLMDLGTPIAELFEDCYGGQYNDKMSKMMQCLLVAQQQIINAEVQRGFDSNE